MRKGTTTVNPTHLNDALKTRAKLQGQVVDKKEIIDNRFPGKSERQIAHYAETGRWVPDEELDKLERVQ